MEQYDAAKARRVWQRVQTQEPPPPGSPALQTLMEEAWEDAKLFRDMARRHKGQTATQFQFLYRQTMAHLRILKGVCALTEQCDPVFSQKPVPRETMSLALRRSYNRALQRLSWYAAKENDPQFGHILPLLIRQTRQHTQMLLQLMAPPGRK